MRQPHFQPQVISDAALWIVPARWTRRDIVVLKFGGTTAGSPQEEGRIRLARELIRDLIDDGKSVVPVFSAFRRGRSQSSDKVSVTDILLSYRGNIRQDADLATGSTALRNQLADIHFGLIDDLQLSDDADLATRISNELTLIQQMAMVSCAAYESIPSLDDYIITSGERMMVEIMASYFNRSHRLGRFPQPARAATAMELGIFTDGTFGDAAIEWPRAVENARETLFANFIEQGIMPVISGFDGVYQPQEPGHQEAGQLAAHETAQGKVFRTSLGRGGSDLTATFLGLALDAEYVGFCKETPGVLTADDKLVGEQARTLPALDYELATEAGNIYSKAMDPVRAGSVPVHIFDPQHPQVRTVISHESLKPGIYIVERPTRTVNIHVGPIPDRPGSLSGLLRVFAECQVNVEEVRHQRCGTDCIVTGDDESIQNSIQEFSRLGYRILSQFTWYIRAIGIINEQLAAEFNDFMLEYEPLTLSSYQLGTRVLTATVARNRACEVLQETGRIEQIIKQLHRQLLLPVEDDKANTLESSATHCQNS